MSYRGFQNYSGNYQTSNNQSSHYGADRLSSAASPALATPAYQLPNGKDQYSPVANAWSDRNQLGHGFLNGNVQSYDNTRWRDGQTQQPTFDYQPPQANYPTSMMNQPGQNGWYSAATTQPNTMSSTQALSNLADASRASLQGQQPHEDRQAATRNTDSRQYSKTQHDWYGQGKAQSPSYTGPYPVSHVRSPKTSQPARRKSPLQQRPPTSAAPMQASKVSRRYNNSPRPQHVSAQQYQVSASTSIQPPSQEANATGPQQTRTETQTPPQEQPRPTPNARPQPNYSLLRYETTGSPLTHSKGSAFTLLPLPVKRKSETEFLHAGTQQQDQSSGIGSSFPNNVRSGIAHSAEKTNTEPFEAPPRQQGQQPPAAVSSFVDPSQVYSPHHQGQERQRREEAEHARQPATETSQPSGSARDREMSTGPSGEAALVVGETDDTQNVSKATGSQEPAARRASEVGSNVADGSKDSEEVDMAGQMKQMMQRMREWKTKDPSLFQKLWDDMKKGSGGVSTQPMRVQTPTPSPRFTQLAPKQSAKAPNPVTSNGTTSHSRPLMAAVPQSTGTLAPEVSHPPASHSRLVRGPTEQTAQTAEARIPNLSSASHQHSTGPHHQRLHLSAGPERNGGMNNLATYGNGAGTPQQVLAEAQGAMPTTSAVPAEAGKTSSKTSQQMPPTAMPATAAQKKRDKNLLENRKLQPATTAPLNPSMGGNRPDSVARQVLSPANSPGPTIWPEAKRKALAKAAQKVLMGVDVNKGKSITTAEIHALLEQNPSYTDLCANLEARGFVFHRGQFARYLINSIPDLASPSALPTDIPQKAGSFKPANLSDPSLVPKYQAPITTLPTTNHLMLNVNQPSRTSPSVNHSLLANRGPKATPVPKARSRLGVPSPRIPAPVPGSKEANARKRDFSELVDLTQLSDDEDYVMPRKQARSEASPEKEAIQAESDITTIAPRLSEPAERPYGSHAKTAFEQKGGSAPLKFVARSSFPTNRVQSGLSAQPSQAIQHKKCQNCFAKPLNKAEALCKSYYNPKTIARDVLIAAGRHPGEGALNAHLAGLLGKHIDTDSDLSTLDWDNVDPGGPPMPIVEVVPIPAGPPRWRIGQRPLPPAQPGGTFEAPARIKPQDESRRPAGEAAGSKKAFDLQPGERASKRKKVKENGGPDLQSADVGPKSTSRTLPPEALSQPRPQPPEEPPQQQQQQQQQQQEGPKQPPSKSIGQLVQSHRHQNASDDSKSSPRVVSDVEITPHPANSGPVTSTTVSISPAPEKSPRRTTVPSRHRKSIVMERPGGEASGKRRKGRPPGAKNKHPSVAALKKSAGSSNLEISIPGRHRSASPQYSIFACQWHDCDAELHNLSTLRKHIFRAHKVADDDMKNEGQACWWRKCRTLEATEEGGPFPRVTFNSTLDWSDHLESDHLYPLGMELGDGPSAAQTVARDRTKYLCDPQGRIVTAPSTRTSIADYLADTLILSSVSMDADSNVSSRAFSKTHGNGNMDVKQSAVETLVALQKHKEKVGPGLDRGGCTLVNAERRATLSDSEGMARVVDGDY